MTERNNQKKSVKITAKIVIIIIILAGAALIIFNMLPLGKSGNLPQNKPANGGPPAMDSGGPPITDAVDMPEDDAVSVNVLKIARTSTIEDYLKTNGDIISRKSINIYPDIGGKLVKLHVSLGDFVRNNQVIAEVDPSKPGSIYAHNMVRSTISGTIAELPTDLGSTVNTQSSIAVVGDLNSLIIQCFISERFVSKIKIGQQAVFSLEAYPDIDFTAKIAEKSPVLDRESRTLEIRLRPEPMDGRIQAGMLASVKLITQRKLNVITVPKECLINSDGGIWVFVVNNDNTARKRKVKTGLSSDGLVEITEGLAEGDSVVIGGQNMLSDGTLVRVIEESGSSQ